MNTDLPIGTFRTPKGILSGLWATQRPLTGKWGSGQVFQRLESLSNAVGWHPIDVVFGMQDQIPKRPNLTTIDKDPAVGATITADWNDLGRFEDHHFSYGYWDPPYFATRDEGRMIHYNRLQKCYAEIARVLKSRLAILHPLIYPNLDGWHRVAVIAVTFGPNKVIRALQVYERDEQQSLEQA